MNRSAAHNTGPSDSDGGHESFDARVRAARLAAGRQELTLCESSVQCGGEEDTRFDLIYERYNQPVAFNLKLTDVEVWLGVRNGPR